MLCANSVQEAQDFALIAQVATLESRLPFLDYQLVQVALSIKNRFKIKDGWTKSILRKGCEDILPASVAWRPRKISFEGPEKDWYKNSRAIRGQLADSRILGEVTRTIPEHFGDPKLLWRLYNIARWEARFQVRP